MARESDGRLGGRKEGSEGGREGEGRFCCDGDVILVFVGVVELFFYYFVSL